MKILLELLTPGMITAEDVYSLNGQLLVPIGTPLTDAMLHQMKIHSIRSVNIDDHPKAASTASGHTSDIPEEVRKARVEHIYE